MTYNDELRKSKERLPHEVLKWFWRFYEQEKLRVLYPQGSRRVLDFLDFQQRRELAISDISESLLVDYLLWVDHHWSNRCGRLHYRYALRLWLRFLYRQKVILRPWHEEISNRCQGESRKRKPLTYAQVKQLLQAQNPGTPGGLLFRAALELLYGCALRRGELHALNLADIDLQERVVYVRCSKNGNGRALPLTEAAHHFLFRYLCEVRPSWCQEHSDDAFFLEGNGQRFHPKWLTHHRGAHNRAELGFDFGLHQLRHSCATHLLLAGLEVTYIQAFLGHRCLSSTQIYTHLTPVELQRIHARCHPANGG
jgi:integrase/recombinase XerD